MFNKKRVERICGNCQLYNPKAGICSIVVLLEGERQHIPVDPKDDCFFEEGEGGFIEDVKQVKFWVENEKGDKTDKDGVVKMEYPEGFFGED